LILFFYLLGQRSKPTTAANWPKRATKKYCRNYCTKWATENTRWARSKN